MLYIKTVRVKTILENMKKVTFVVSLISVMVFGFASCSDKEQKLDFPASWGELTSIRCVGQDTTTMHYLRADGTVDSTTVVRYLMEDVHPSEPKEVFFPASWGKLLSVTSFKRTLLPFTKWEPMNGWGNLRIDDEAFSADWYENGKVVTTYSIRRNIKPLTHWEPVL